MDLYACVMVKIGASWDGAVGKAALERSRFGSASLTHCREKPVSVTTDRHRDAGGDPSLTVSFKP